MAYTMPQMVLYIFIYSFLGWVCETIVIAIKERHYRSRSLLNLPLVLTYGCSAALLLIGLPRLDNMLLQYLLCLITFRVVRLLCNQFVVSLSGHPRLIVEYTASLSPIVRHLLIAAIAAVCYGVYLVVHPLIFLWVNLLPQTLTKVIAAAAVLLVFADFLSVLYTLRTHRLSAAAEHRRERTGRLSSRITLAIRNRLHRAYPGILTPDPSDDGDHTFARGICFDKLVWVFLVSAFLGALIEMLYCYALDGYFMNRSSLLYGAFSVVWGLGAVVLTVALHKIAELQDRWIFAAGFFIGGAYEYLCSVFTEVVFGRVFWDYSWMPLNIGGRTNVLYCLFWGILAVVWIKMIYPRMSALIERIPAIQGKLMTWLIVIVMGCNCILTAGAMVRYDLRQTDNSSPNTFEAILDSRYDDAWMEHRWPNMKGA